MAVGSGEDDDPVIPGSAFEARGVLAGALDEDLDGAAHVGGAYRGRQPVDQGQQTHGAPDDSLGTGSSAAAGVSRRGGYEEVRLVEGDLSSQRDIVCAKSSLGFAWESQ